MGYLKHAVDEDVRQKMYDFIELNCYFLRISFIFYQLFVAISVIYLFCLQIYRKMKHWHYYIEY